VTQHWKSLYEVHQSNPVNPLEDLWDLENMHRFQSSEPWNSLKMKSVRSRIDPLLLHVSDWVDSLIAPSGLLLVVSNLLAVPVSVLWVRLGKKISN
jgi:hypothetical protein